MTFRQFSKDLVELVLCVAIVIVIGFFAAVGYDIALCPRLFQFLAVSKTMRLFLARTQSSI